MFIIFILFRVKFSYLLHAIFLPIFLDDVIDFYNTPVDPRIPLERMKDMELPPNLYIKQDYVTFDQRE